MISVSELFDEIVAEAARLIRDSAGRPMREVCVHPETFRRMVGELGARARYSSVAPMLGSVYFDVFTPAGYRRVQSDPAARVVDHLYFKEPTSCPGS